VDKRCVTVVVVDSGVSGLEITAGTIMISMLMLRRVQDIVGGCGLALLRNDGRRWAWNVRAGLPWAGQRVDSCRVIGFMW
jgi:hypothetical protein